MNPDPLHVDEEPVPEPAVSWAGWIPLLAVLLVTVIAVIWRSTRP